MKLYISAASSFSRKVRVLLIEKHLPHEVEVLDLWQPNELQNVNPIGKVPALALDAGRFPALARLAQQLEARESFRATTPPPL